jgi:hypothetical protein
MHLHYNGQVLFREEKENVTSITIDATAIRHKIPNGAFCYCMRLTRVDIPHSITKIADWAFAYCHSLLHIRLPQDLTSIGRQAFIRCHSLTHVHIPDGVSEIGDNAFSFCRALRHVNIPRSLTSILGWYTFVECQSLTRIDIPDGIVTIENGAFSGCTSLTRVNLPDSLRTLMADAFLDCESLEQIHIPEGVERIEKNTFQGCRSLRYVHIPQSMRHMNLWAFRECKTLLGQYGSVYPNELPDGYTSDSKISWGTFQNWLRTRYDEYPLLKTCWRKNVTMVDIAQCVEDNGVDCLLEVEKGTGLNGFDILLLNHYVVENDALGLIAGIILMLLCQKQGKNS